MTTVAGPFRTSSRCSQGGCLEAAPLSDGGAVIRSTLRPGLSLTLTGPEWADLLAWAKRGDIK